MQTLMNILPINALTIAAPEIFLATLASLILILDQFLASRIKWIAYFLSQLTVIITFFLILELWNLQTGTSNTQPLQNIQTLFQGQFILDNMAILLKLSILFIAFFVFIYSRRYIFLQHSYHGEYFVLCLFSIFGMMVLVSAGSFLTLFLGVELITLPIYALITMIKPNKFERSALASHSNPLEHEKQNNDLNLKSEKIDKSAPEAAMKYFVMGAIASGMLLYGISLLYGATGSFDLAEVSRQLNLQSNETPQLALLFGLVFVLVGMAFKFGAVPFHMWLPDVYQGAPMPMTLFVGTLPKIAAFGLAIRLLVNTFSGLDPHWQQLVMVMAILSLAVGNIAAIVQSNLKRMLAYSAIAHIGFIFLGLLAGPEAGFAAAMDYVLIYALMALAIFGIMAALSYHGFEAEKIEDFSGLGIRYPWIAFLMMIILFSLAGIPPFAGFYAKFFVLDALIKAGFTWLAVVAVLFTVIAAYYYLRVIKVMFFDKPLESVHFHKISGKGIAVISFNSLTILALGIFPAPLLNLCLIALGHG